MREDGFEFGAEIKILAAECEIERLDPHSIAREHQTLGRFRPQRHSEHPAHFGKAIRVPFEKRLQYRFRIAVRMELAPASFQLLAQLQMIVNFPVERDHRPSGSICYWLIAAVQIDDLQARSAKRNSSRFENALLIRPAMQQRCDRILNSAWMRNVVTMREPSDPAQLSYLPSVGTSRSRLALQGCNCRRGHGLRTRIPGVSPVDLRKEQGDVDAILILHRDIHERVKQRVIQEMRP